MAVTPEARNWDDLFAARTRVEVGAGLADILALAGDTTLIPFAGGFPDAQTFPDSAVADLLGELVAARDQSAFQYAPTAGLPGLREVVADRLAAHQGRRPAADEVLITSGTVEALAYHGLDLQLHVRTGLADKPFLVRITADTADRRKLSVGDTVEIGWAATDTRIFRN